MHNPGQSIRLRGSALTNKGQVRENNEDRVHLWFSDRDNLLLAIVADGMGGAAAGEEASRIAIDTIHADISDSTRNDIAQLKALHEDEIVKKLREAVKDANERIMERAHSMPEYKGMGTTLTLAFARDNQAIVVHVGDSRAYLVDGIDGAITQITSDHSFVQALVDAGHIQPEEADDHPMRNVLYRALGQSPDIDIDVYYNNLHIGDTLVLCSDGLTLHVQPQEIADIARDETDPAAAARRLIALANERGGRDNVSVVVIRVDALEQSAESQAASAEGEDDAKDDDATIILRDRERWGFAPKQPEDNESPKAQVSPVLGETERISVVSPHYIIAAAEGHNDDSFNQ